MIDYENMNKGEIRNAQEVPRVSVIIPTHNRSALLKRSIASVLNQTYSNFELIVVDDGSTDDTHEVVKSINDERIRYIRHEINKGSAAASNTGLNAAIGEFIAFQGSDDEWMPEKLGKQLEAFYSVEPEVGVVYSDMLRVDEKGKIEYWYSPTVSFGSLINSVTLDYQVINIGNGSALIKKECFNKVGFFDETFPRFIDLELFVRLSQYYHFHHIKIPLVKYYSTKGVSSDVIGACIARLLLLKKYFYCLKENEDFLLNQYSLINQALLLLKNEQTSFSNILEDRDNRINALNAQLEEAISAAKQAVADGQAFRKEIADRDDRLAELNAQLEEAVSATKQAVADGQIFRKEIANRDDRLAELNNQREKAALTGKKLEVGPQTFRKEIADRENRLKEATIRVNTLEAEVAEMRRTILYQLTMRYQNDFVNPIMPHGTLRRHIYDLGLEGGRILVNEGCGKFLCSVRKKLLKKGPFQKIPTIENNILGPTNLTTLILEDALIGEFSFPLNELNEIEILTATFLRDNTDLVLTISRTLNGPIIRKVKIKNQDIIDNGFTSFKFDPIVDSAKKIFFFSLKSVGKPSAAVWYDDSEPIPRKIQLFRNNDKLIGGISFRAFTKLRTNDPYGIWIMKNEPSKGELETCKEKSKLFKYRPKISIITPVWNTEERWLKQAIESVLNQVYDNWELCIADGGSTRPYIKDILNYYAKKDSRIKVKFLTVNKGISLNSNEALSLATGEFIALLDHDDELAPFALFEVIQAINKNPEVEFIYSDRDMISTKGHRFEPFFKPDWSPDYLLSQNYLCHLNVIQKQLIDKVGWFREKYDGSQDYDLVLRITEKTDKILHIPKILYHWRVVSTSVASDMDVKPFAISAALRSLQDAFDRRNWNAIASQGSVKGLYRVKFQLNNNPKVSIIIPTKDKVEILKKCVNSILNKTTYKNYEIIIIDNNSFEKKTFKYYDELFPLPNVKLFTYNKPFNFSNINNYAVSKTNSEFILLLNNDIEVITNNWLELMLGFAQRKETGAVGVKLIYSNEKIQHAGLILDKKGNIRRSHYCYPRNSLGYAGRILSIQNVSAVAAACMMVRREVFNEVNGLDPRFAIAHGDIDFCLKLMDKGYLIVYEPHVELYHYESLTRGYEDTPEKVKRLNNETNLLVEKWGQALEDRYFNPNLTSEHEDFRIKI